jgi:hypothetical protein
MMRQPASNIAWSLLTVMACRAAGKLTQTLLGAFWRLRPAELAANSFKHCSWPSDGRGLLSWRQTAANIAWGLLTVVAC